MLFNSYVFIFLFLPIVITVYFLLQKKTSNAISQSFLVLASYFFYAYWNPHFLPFILISIYANYFIGLRISKTRSLPTLVFGIVLNLAPLLYFKYTAFLLEISNFLFGTQFKDVSLTLPLAISFFTFQQIAFLVDAYKALTKEYDVTSYSLFVSFFPQLIAGPIVHHKQVISQFRSLKSRYFSKHNFILGISYFSVGLFKKTVLADTLSRYVTNGFDNLITLDFFEAWFASLAYTFQLYFDFSGYSDMAVGLGLMINIAIPENFMSPYQARNLRDFWKRWHMTLGAWLRDYIYVPIGGNRLGALRTARNLFITFLIGGIWHGAGINFVIWGALHGIGVSAHLPLSRLRISIPKVVSIALTFFYVHICWVFFRSKSFERAVDLVSSLFGINGFNLPKNVDRILGIPHLPDEKPWISLIVGNESNKYLLIYLVVSASICFFLPNTRAFLTNIKNRRYLPYFIAGLLAIGIVFISRESEFLYFQF